MIVCHTRTVLTTQGKFMNCIIALALGATAAITVLAVAPVAPLAPGIQIVAPRAPAVAPYVAPRKPYTPPDWEAYLLAFKEA